METDQPEGPGPDDEIQREDIESESLEEESQFEQSIFFNKGHKKLGNEDRQLLEKIQEYGGEEEDKEMILGKVDEK